MIEIIIIYNYVFSKVCIMKGLLVFQQQRWFPDVEVQKRCKIDVIECIVSKWVIQYLCYSQPTKDQNINQNLNEKLYFGAILLNLTPCPGKSRTRNCKKCQNPSISSCFVSWLAHIPIAIQPQTANHMAYKCTYKFS